MQNLTDNQKTSIEFIKGLAKTTGINFELYKSGADSKTGKKIGANAEYNSKTNTIKVDIDAGIDFVDVDTGKFKTGDNSMIRAVSHELTHFIKDWSPKQYSVLQEIVLSNYTAEELENAIAHQQSKDKSLSREEAIEEVVCDSCETMFKDNADLMKQISQKSPKLAEKIKSWLDKIITNLKKVLDELNPKSQEAKIIERNMNAFKEVQKQWNSALISATVNSNSVSEDFKVGNAEATLLSSRENNEILNLVKKVKKGDYKSNEKVYLGNISVDVATRIKQLTNIDVTDFKVAIEARQINHILKDHGENGKTDHSMSDNNIAKIEFALTDPTYISKGGRTQAYSYMKNGKNKTAETVIYEKETGEKSFYVVQAIPDTKAKTLYVVTAFIGKKGYKKETSQLINAKSPNATPKSGSVVVSIDNISQNNKVVNNSISENSKNDTKFSVDELSEDQQKTLATALYTVNKHAKAIRDVKQQINYYKTTPRDYWDNRFTFSNETKKVLKSFAKENSYNNVNKMDFEIDPFGELAVNQKSIDFTDEDLEKYPQYQLDDLADIEAIDNALKKDLSENAKKDLMFQKQVLLEEKNIIHDLWNTRQQKNSMLSNNFDYDKKHDVLSKLNLEPIAYHEFADGSIRALYQVGDFTFHSDALKNSEIPDNAEITEIENSVISAENKLDNKMSYDEANEIINGYLNDSVKFSVDNTKQSARDNDYMSAVESGDTDKAQEMVDEQAEKQFVNSKVRSKDGKLRKVYHSRTSLFNVFSRKFANIEGDFGKGYYFSSDYNDSSKNYGEDGADLANKIAREAEKIEILSDGKTSYEEAEEIARKKFVTSEANVIECYLDIKNPVLIAPNESGTFFDFDENYNEVFDEYGEPEGTLIDFVEALQNQSKQYDYFENTDFSFLYENAFDGGIYAADAVQEIKNHIIDELIDENGDIAVSEVIRLAFEEMGYDGIIDSSVSYKFRNMNLDRNTTHYVVFNSNQIKSADAITYDDDGNVIPLSKRFDENDNDIRFSLRNANIDENTDFTNVIKKVANMESVIDLTGNEFAKSNVNLLDQVTNYFNLIGNVVESKYGMVRINKQGIKSSIAHGIGRNKAIAFKAIPYVLKEGEIVNYKNNYKNRGYDSAVFAAPINIGKDNYYMAVVVKVNQDENTFYLHEVALQKNKDDLPFKTGTVDNNGTPSDKSSSIFSLFKNLQNVKGKNEKNSLRDNEVLDREQIESIIKEQFGNYSRTNDFKNNVLGELSKKLDVAYTLMTDRNTIEDGKARLKDIAAEIYDKTPENIKKGEEYKAFRELVQRYGIKYTEELKAELGDDSARFMKENSKRLNIKIANKASIDVVYEDLLLDGYVSGEAQAMWQEAVNGKATKNDIAIGSALLEMYANNNCFFKMNFNC